MIYKICSTAFSLAVLMKRARACDTNDAKRTLTEELGEALQKVMEEAQTLLHNENGEAGDRITQLPSIRCPMKMALSCTNAKLRDLEKAITEYGDNKSEDGKCSDEEIQEFIWLKNRLNEKSEYLLRQWYLKNGIRMAAYTTVLDDNHNNIIITRELRKQELAKKTNKMFLSKQEQISMKCMVVDHPDAIYKQIMTAVEAINTLDDNWDAQIVAPIVLNEQISLLEHMQRVMKTIESREKRKNESKQTTKKNKKQIQQQQQNLQRLHDKETKKTEITEYLHKTITKRNDMKRKVEKTLKQLRKNKKKINKLMKKDTINKEILDILTKRREKGKTLENLAKTLTEKEEKLLRKTIKKQMKLLIISNKLSGFRGELSMIRDVSDQVESAEEKERSSQSEEEEEE